MIARFRVANNNPYPVKDVVVRCLHRLPATNEMGSFRIGTRSTKQLRRPQRSQSTIPIWAISIPMS